jgi:glutamyl-tRNA reductase
MTIFRRHKVSLPRVEIRELQVLHWRGQHVAGPLVPELSGRELFLIDTCQRRVGIVLGAAALAAARRLFPGEANLEVFSGLEAYAFLMRFACGLESKLIAETEIFGQIKQAWRAFCERPSLLSRELSPWVQQLFQDAKAVRAEYLSRLGSASYGSQVRRLLGADSASGPTLLLGAGQLSQSLAPWLECSELWLWNRTNERAAELARELSKRSPERPVQVIACDVDAELAAWRAARDIVICVPVDPIRDAARIAAWHAAPRAGHIIHLGLNPGVETAWSGLSGLVSLGDMFEMLRSQSEQRRRQIEQARRACAEKAMLRSLGAGTQPHSWEDLAAFHSL